MISPGQSSAIVPADAPVGPPAPLGAPYPYEDPPSSTGQRLVFGAVCMVVGVVAALAAAWLWSSVADPPSARLTQAGLKFGELDFDHVTQITMWFAVISFGFGLVLGFLLALFGRSHGLMAVLAILVMSWVGGSLMLWFGIHVFGPGRPLDFVALFNATPKQRTRMLDGFEQGDLLVSTLRLTSPIGLIAWPIGGMLGTLLAASSWPSRQKRPQVPLR